MKMQKTLEGILNDAILETLPPVADYDNAIKILKDNYENYPDFRIAVLASFLSSTWQNFKPNEFLTVLDSYFETSDNQEKSVILYLNAYDIFMHSEDQNQADKYRALLLKSTELSTSFVYNHYRLAMISNQHDAKRQMEKALKQVVIKDNSVFSSADLVSYERFLNEHILGIELSMPNYRMFLDITDEGV